MADIMAVQAEIAAELDRRKRKIVNRTSIAAALAGMGALLTGDGAKLLETIKNIFSESQEKLDLEKQKITMEMILDLVCRMDSSITQAKEEAAKNGAISLDGLIQVAARDADYAAGAFIAKGGRPVEFKPGTKIDLTAKNVRRAVGLQIGGTPGDMESNT